MHFAVRLYGGGDIGARPFLFLACRLRRKLGHEEGPAVGKRKK